MIKIGVVVTGLDSVVKRFDTLASDVRVQDGVLRAARVIRDELVNYPSQSVTSRYVRKGFNGGLASAWLIEQRGERRTVYLRNNKPYAAWVQGTSQVWFHKRTGWRDVTVVLGDVSARVADVVVDAVVS